jgi:hypothetical protein
VPGYAGDPATVIEDNHASTSGDNVGTKITDITRRCSSLAARCRNFIVNFVANLIRDWAIRYLFATKFATKRQ